MKPAVSPSALRVQAALGDGHQVLEFDRSVRTAAEAAATIGCAVAQIAKSIVFRAVNSGRSVLVIASGPNRIDEGRVAELIGEPIARADANFVREATGFAIGGVPPVAHKSPPIVLIDDALSALAEIWAAAGTPHAVVKLTFGDLVALTKGKVAAVARPAD
jgi:prolyl-tRNA editing enzyme YbaK/EbsC (Cys-tRNA(Pro) deacylase)